MKDGPEKVDETSAESEMFDIDNEDDSISDEEVFESVLQVSDILQKFSKMSMGSAFPNLSLAYKAICTLPPMSASAERCFSKLKLINLIYVQL